MYKVGDRVVWNGHAATVTEIGLSHEWSFESGVSILVDGRATPRDVAITSIIKLA